MPLETTLSTPGGRRLTLSMIAARNQADGFSGLAPGAAKPLRLLAAFQEAEPYLGLPPQAFKLVAWLMKMTRPQDWQTGSRPIAWPSAARQQEFLGLAPSAVKTLNRTLYAAGVFVLRDSPTGKRYGRRDGEGRIVEAYGFDLSPLALRADEFVRIAAQARAERQRMQALKRRATCARRALAEIGAALAGAPPAGWSQLAAEAADLVKAIAKAQTCERLDALVDRLERAQAQAQAWGAELGQSRQTGPVRPGQRPHIITTETNEYPSDTVTVRRQAGDSAARAKTTCDAVGLETDAAPSRPLERGANIYPAELLQLATRLAEHVAQPYPDWADIVNGAGEGLRRELGVSAKLWGEACLALGRRTAAIALAVVATKPREHFQRGAAVYFAAMIKRAASGELHLERSLWKLRSDRLDRIERETGQPIRAPGKAASRTVG